MTSNERARLIDALYERGINDMAGFKIESWHGLNTGDNKTLDYWDVILVPMLNRIYLVSEIREIVDSLDIHIAVYTDTDRPGCIIFH